MQQESRICSETLIFRTAFTPYHAANYNCLCIGVASIVVQDAPAYFPVILKTVAEICKAFGIGPATVRNWIDRGAPIVVDGKGSRTRYSAETMRLQLWREKDAEQKKESHKSDKLHKTP